MYDHLPSLEAALRAWSNYGPCPQYHMLMQNQVREAMPLLARALDRAAQERKQHESHVGHR